jgi:arylsulfatase A-like enzyme
VPLIVKWPGVTRPGAVIGEPATSTDLYPTCLAAAGQSPRPNQHRDGLNLLPLFQGMDPLGREAIFWHFPHYNRHPSSVPSSVIRKGSWKLIETFDPEGVELYNLANDLGETNNLAGERPDLMNALRRELRAWRREVGAEMMQPNPNHDPVVKIQRKGNRKDRLTDRR